MKNKKNPLKSMVCIKMHRKTNTFLQNNVKSLINKIFCLITIEILQKKYIIIRLAGFCRFLT